MCVFVPASELSEIFPRSGVVSSVIEIYEANKINENVFVELPLAKEIGELQPTMLMGSAIF